MGIMTSQRIAVFYERFKAIDVTFSKEIIRVAGLVANQVYLKCVGDFWPCVIYSTSFQSAKVIVSLKSGILQKLERANNMVSLRFCFKIEEKGNPVAFFVNTKSIGYTSYGGSQDVALFSLQFTQRPPDDLIEIMGRLLDANVNSAKRREERIMISADSMRKLNIVSRESAVFIQKVPRNCILRDISFSGAKLIMVGVAKFLVDKEAALRIDFDDPRESFLIKGKFLRAEMVEGRKDLIALVLLFDESVVPMGYKLRINDYISVTRADERGSERGAKEDKAAAPQPPSAPEPPVAPQPAAPPPAADAPQQPAAPRPAAPPPAQGAPKAPAKKDPPGGDDFDLNLPS